MEDIGSSHCIMAALAYSVGDASVGRLLFDLLLIFILIMINAFYFENCQEPFSESILEKSCEKRNSSYTTTSQELVKKRYIKRIGNNVSGFWKIVR